VYRLTHHDEKRGILPKSKRVLMEKYWDRKQYMSKSKKKRKLKRIVPKGYPEYGR